MATSNKTYQKKKKTLAESQNEFNINHGYVLPNDIQLEESLVGALIIYYNSVITVSQILKTTDFYSESFGTIYKSIISLFESGEAISSLALIKQLRKTSELDFVGGAAKIARLGNTDLVEVERSAYYLVELSRKRQLIQLTHKICQQSYQDTSDVFELVSETQNGILELLDFKFSKDTEFSKVAKKTYEKIVQKRVGALEGLPSKFKNNNELTGGYRRGTLRTIAARPGIGKSTHLVNEASNLALLGYVVMIFSLEMPAQEVTKRIMSISTQIETWKLDKNALSESEHLVLQNFVDKSIESNINIDDSAGVDFLYIASQIKKVKMKNEMIDKSKSGMDVVFIDYVQIMKMHNDNRNVGIGEITRSLKTLSKDLDICIVIYSQLNRSVESRGGDKRPFLSDLKESGSIEEDSDVVEFLYRAEKYGITEDENGESTAGIMEIITEKNRQGANGITKVKFIPSISTLLDTNQVFDNNSMTNINNINDFENQVPKQTKADF
jgi:replicative DNA helicase